MKKPKLVDLNDAVQHPGRHVVYDLSTELEDEEDLDLLEPVSGSLDVVSTGNMLLITGEFRAVLVLECSRCLLPVHVEVEFQLDEEFPVRGTPSGFGNREYAEVEADELYPLFEGNSLRYEDLLRQNLLVNLPLRPLCREDCPGLPGASEGAEVGRPEFKKLSKLLDNGPEAHG